MIHWRPSPDEERWLEVGQRFRELPRDEMIRRAGGWRGVGPLARIALFLLGAISAGLLLLLIGLERPLVLISGMVAIAASEWLKVGRRLHASGFEEGLAATGWLLVAIWLAGEFAAARQEQALLFIGGCAVALAGARLLNPFLTTCAAVALLEACSSTAYARAFNDLAGSSGAFEFAAACVGAACALAAGSKLFRRPAHDRMLDGLVIVLPVVGFLHDFDRLTWSPSGLANQGAPVHALASLVLAGLGIAMLLTGLRRRRHAPLLGSLACVSCAFVEATRFVSWPVEAWLVGDGLLAIGIAAFVDRRWRATRSGITSAKLEENEDPLDLAQLGATAALAAQAGRVEAESVPTAERDGRFGGGGASGSY
jgi:hypothetical protein